MRLTGNVLDLLAVFFPRLRSIIPFFKVLTFSNLDDDVISLPVSLSTSAQKEFQFSFAVGRDFVELVAKAFQTALKGSLIYPTEFLEYGRSSAHL